MNRAFRTIALSTCLVAAAAWIVGCSGKDDSSAAKTAEEALGVKSLNETTTAKGAREIDIIEDTKAVDHKTGEVLSDKKVVTPVKVVTEQREKIDVNVGKPQATAK